MVNHLMIQRAFAICLISSGLNFALQGSSFSVRTKAKCSRPSIFAIHLKASADESRDKPEFPLDANLKKADAKIKRVNRQNAKTEKEIATAENQANEARINGNEKFFKMVRKLMAEEKKLMDRVNQLEEQMTVLLKSIPNEGFIDQEQKQKAVAQGEAFVSAILADMEEIKVTQTNETTENAKSYEVSGMQVLRDVPMLETGARCDVVVRPITEPFWKACIEWVDTPNRKYRVCAIGTPGIGKSTTTATLIRLLLQQR